MGEMGEMTKKQSQQQQSQHQQPMPQQISVRPIHHPQQFSPFNISTPMCVSSAASSSPFEQQFKTTVNPKRPRYSRGQWKLFPSPASSQPK